MYAKNCYIGANHIVRMYACRPHDNKLAESRSLLVALSRHPTPINPLLLIFPLFGPCIMGDLSTPTLKGVLTKGTTPFRPSRPSFVEGGDSGRRLDFPGRGRDGVGLRVRKERGRG